MRRQPDQRFPPAARLRRPEEFKLTLGSRRRKRGAWFTLAVSANTLDRSRVGIIVPRRLVATAVQRNRIKRIVRDAFRRTTPPLPAVDLVIQMHAAPPSRGSNGALREEVIRLLEWSRG